VARAAAVEKIIDRRRIVEFRDGDSRIASLPTEVSLQTLPDWAGRSAKFAEDRAANLVVRNLKFGFPAPAFDPVTGQTQEIPAK
jgi:hypothetical protein